LDGLVLQGINVFFCSSLHEPALKSLQHESNLVVILTFVQVHISLPKAICTKPKSKIKKGSETK